MAAGTKSRKYLNYNRLQQVLARAKFRSSGALATHLLETFIEHDGRMLAAAVYARGLCEENQFREWRKDLIDKGWLIWSESQQDKGVYFPGKKLITYINKEIHSREQVATRSSVERVRSDLDAKIDTKADRADFEKTKAELAETRNTIAKIAEAVRELQEAMLPPDTPEKRRRREKAASAIANHVRAN
jgi:hypothetical protein